MLKTKNGYTRRAVRTEVHGHTRIGWAKDVHTYDSQLEAKMASLLIQYGIIFKAHQAYWLDKCGEGLCYVVDFELSQPQKFIGLDGLIKFVEVKGWVSSLDYAKMRTLEEQTDHKGAIVFAEQIDMWDREGLLG